MRVFVVDSGQIIAPWGVPVDDCPLGASTFGQSRDAWLPSTRIGPDDVVTGPALVLSDDTWVTRRAVRSFVQAAKARATPSRLCLPPSRLLSLFLPLQDVPQDAAGRAAFACAYVPTGSVRAADVLALAADHWVAPAYREIEMEVPAPPHILGRAPGSFPLTSTVAMRVRHWVHVLRASHLAPQVALLDDATKNPLRAALRLGLGIRPNKTAREQAWRRAFVNVGRRTFIHPTAVVEASVLGDDVFVGAHAVVMGSVVGDGCRIEQRAHVFQSTLGPRTFVSLNSSLSACATFGDTDACINGVQACVVGPRCGLTSFAHPLDLVMNGAVQVDDGGVLRDAGPLPCGVAFGADVFVGAGVYIAAGRAVPAGVRLYRAPSDTLMRVPASLEPGNYVVEDGGARAVSAPQGGETPMGSKR